jgi:ribosome-associated toxin RatA of RatAB toxin-antitoxin module
MKSRRDFVLAVLGVLLARRAFGNEAVQQKGITVNVEAHGKLIVADVSFDMPANADEFWAVLTDYDHMSDFLPNLAYSKKLDDSAETFQVAQRGKAFLGPFAISFAYIQEVTLTPYKEIRFHLISGTFKQLDGVVQLFEIGGGTRVIYHGVSIPTFPLPSAIIVVMTEQTIRDQFESMKEEILQRKHNRPR